MESPQQLLIPQSHRHAHHVVIDTPVKKAHRCSEPLISSKGTPFPAVRFLLSFVLSMAIATTHPCCPFLAVPG